jgi:hypothetical protein
MSLPLKRLDASRRGDGDAFEVVSVIGMQMRVMALGDVLATGPTASSRRADVRTRTIESRFARAVFPMPEGLGVVPGAKPSTGGEPRVRVHAPHGSSAAHVG